MTCTRGIGKDVQLRVPAVGLTFPAMQESKNHLVLRAHKNLFTT